MPQLTFKDIKTDGKFTYRNCLWEKTSGTTARIMGFHVNQTINDNEAVGLHEEEATGTEEESPESETTDESKQVIKNKISLEESPRPE